MTHKVEIEGAEVELYTLEEVTQRETAAAAAKEGEFVPKLTQAQQELEGAKKALGERAGEFQQFRKLSDEQVAALSVAQRTIYENGLVIAQQQEEIATRDKAAHENAVNTAIRAKVGNNETVFTKAKEMYALINLDDKTPEGIAARVAATIGALGTTQPDLLATAGFAGGGFAPPVEVKQSESFADTDAGKAAAAEFGLTVEPPNPQQ